MSEQPQNRLSAEELAAEGATALPDKEVMSLLDLNANLDLALDAAAPIDLAIGANANIAAPIDAAATANVLSPDAVASGVAHQATSIDQGITGNADATSTQGSTIDQGTAPTTATAPADSTTSVGNLADGNLLNVNVNLDGDLHLAAPIDGAVAANANAAAPIDAAVSANIGSPDATSVAEADQTAIINQDITGDATANADQVSTIDQPGAGSGTGTP
jgi:hypothetical protein